MYPNPSVFEPERYLKGGKLSTEDILDPEAIAFGFGRRYVSEQASNVHAGSLDSHNTIIGYALGATSAMPLCSPSWRQS